MRYPSSISSEVIQETPSQCNFEELYYFKFYDTNAQSHHREDCLKKWLIRLKRTLSGATVFFDNLTQVKNTTQNDVCGTAGIAKIPSEPGPAKEEGIPRL
jgi:hypothetical protein